jgi:hypothetical protein
LGGETLLGGKRKNQTVSSSISNIRFKKQSRDHSIAELKKELEKRDDDDESEVDDSCAPNDINLID